MIQINKKQLHSGCKVRELLYLVSAKHDCYTERHSPIVINGN